MLAPDVVLQDRYRIVRLIAQGGMGAVYQAVDQRLGHAVAVKQIIRHEAALRAAFAHEARLLAALRHPALPKVTDHFVEASGQFLVMDYIPGDDLAVQAQRQQTPFAVDAVLRWADQLLDALDYLHGQTPPVIHRDLKPHNLKLNPHGAVILLDFGLAKGAPGQDAAARSLAGYTLHYAAPEQLRGAHSDPRSDLFSLGATLYDLLAAAKPPDALQRLSAVAGGYTDPLSPLHTVNPAVPVAVAAVIHRALALEPQARFADAAAMRQALHNAAGEATQIVAGMEQLSPPSPTHNLPVQLTSFVAREAEVSAVQRLLQEEGVRLVTLTGPGGIGKTRLALASATRSLASFGDGVTFVSLATLDAPELVLPTLAQTLGVRETPNTTLRQSLHALLHDKQMLLVLDNFEQIVAAATELGDLLAHAPRLKVLVTSREALLVRGEHEYPVPALDLPDLRRLPDPDELGQVAAIRLFVQRAQAVKPDFTLHQTNAAAVAEICKRLDGLPLALELAAASVRLLPVQAILARLAERFDLLGSGLRDLPARQRTLRASIGWSYDLLTQEEQALFRRLSVFAGSFGLDAAEALCRETGLDAIPVLDLIATLAGKSLLKPADMDAAEPRFTLLETIREFGLRQLDAEGEIQAVRDAHAAYYYRLAQEAEQQVWGGAMAEWVARLDEELENLRAALSHFLAQAQGGETALRLAGSLWRFWEIRGYIQEGRGWLERALQRRAEAPPAGRWLALHGAGNLAVDQGDYAVANRHYTESLHLLQELMPTLTEPEPILRTRYAIANTLINLGHTALLQSQCEEAVMFTEEALALHRQLVAQPSNNRLNREAGMALAITNLATIKLYQSDYTAAEALSHEGLSVYRRLGDARGIGWNLQRLGTIARERGEFARAAQLYGESQLLFAKLSNQADMAALYLDLGELVRQQGDLTQAEAAYRTGLDLAQALGNKKETANLLDRLSRVARSRADYATATALSAQSVALQREIGNLFGLSAALYTRGAIALAEQDYPSATASLSESLILKARLGERKGLVDLFTALAALAMSTTGHAARAARLLAAAETLRDAIGVSVSPAERADDEAVRHAVHTVLGQVAWAAAWAEGASMTMDEAVAYALATT